ncbi:DNA cytosine methyltransferase [Skermanella sp. TT6]|uniref:Cytosine-specific methyltransferase n=1 Tax=Skermanella cutis TaxID=2775420 RepID=A0ABX7B635_9PROT|nr:DNA cytosine methyltransferase [Skermanella sp. TT6]QQP89834.1 DNA cytosine methyltransferase [Skermanella sp. TT6]
MPLDFESSLNASEAPAKSSAQATTIDLFCGAGGLSLGLSRAGFRVVSALDNDPVAARTYRRNLGDHINVAQIEDVSADDMLALTGIRRGELSLLAGGPPCQGFSLQRRGDRKDPRNGLVLEFVRLVEELRPQLFLMENVGGLLSKHGKPFLRELSLRAWHLGYVVQVALLDAVDYGVPQYRQRAFLVGEQSNDGIARFKFPDPVSRAKRATVRDAIGDLPSPLADGSVHPDFPNHYREARLSALNIERIKHVPPGGGREHLPEELQLACHRNNPGHRHMDVYGRLAWDEPSVTLTARFDSFTRGRFGHPVEHRSLTIREGARIQTFPDTFVFEGNREDGARQVGNAVPPLFAQRLGDALMRRLYVDTSCTTINSPNDFGLTMELL